jgi:glyoxylase-like metal-dependent hydrolase (beta-lactamase superfamily II)
MKRLAVYALTTCVLIGVLYQRHAASQINTVKELAPGVYFHEGDLRGKGHCNNGWVIFEDYVLVLDANYPSGAQEIIPKIKAQTNKPIRFAFDTHHHGDHAYANQVWVDNGAVPVAHENVVSEMKKYETGFFGGGKPGRWEGEAKERDDLKSTKLKPPSLLYRDVMIFDDGTHRVELRYFGVGHTHGDGFAWLPKERILFTGDAVVNGPFNFMGDGDSAAWIETIAKAQKLGATIIGPGHGPSGDAGVLEAQRQYFVALRAEVEKRKTLAPDRVQAEIPAMRDALLKQHARYIDTNPKSVSGFENQVAKVYRELTGKELLKQAALDAARRAHEAHHER